MAVISYRKTRFTEPDKISASTYLHYKKILSEDPGFELTSNPQSFTTRFRRTLKNFSWMFPLCLVLIGIFAFFFRPSIYTPDAVSITLAVITGIIAVLALGLLTQLLLEGPSYATYLKKRKAYFDQMDLAIKHSVDYQSFYDSFYSSKRIGFLVASTTPPSLDRFLTNLFYTIDKYWWIWVLVVLILFLERKKNFGDS